MAISNNPLFYEDGDVYCVDCPFENDVEKCREWAEKHGKKHVCPNKETYAEACKCLET